MSFNFNYLQTGILKRKASSAICKYFRMLKNINYKSVCLGEYILFIKVNMIVYFLVRSTFRVEEKTQATGQEKTTGKKTTEMTNRKEKRV